MSKEQWIAEVEQIHEDFIDGKITEHEWRTELKHKGYIPKDFETERELLDIMEEAKMEAG